MSKRLFTYKVDFKENEFFEEIDVYADWQPEALELAKAEALDLYGDPDGYTLSPMEPGGTGGLVTIWSY